MSKPTKTPSTTRNLSLLSDFPDSRSRSRFSPDLDFLFPGCYSEHLKRFFLYVRGCRFGVKEGWLLPLTCFKWLKDHSKKNKQTKSIKSMVTPSQLSQVLNRSSTSHRESPYSYQKLQRRIYPVPVSGQSLVT